MKLQVVNGRPGKTLLFMQDMETAERLLTGRRKPPRVRGWRSLPMQTSQCEASPR
jgi:hypothetical protein